MNCSSVVSKLQVAGISLMILAWHGVHVLAQPVGSMSAAWAVTNDWVSVAAVGDVDNDGSRELVVCLLLKQEVWVLDEAFVT